MHQERLTPVVRIRLAFVTSDIDARGNVRYYFRKRGLPHKIRLPSKPHSAEFTAAYSAALAGETLTTRKLTPPADGTLRWLCAQYFASAEFRRFDRKTKVARRRALEAICLQPLSDDDATPIGALGFAVMPPKAVRALRDRKAATPAAANDWLKSMKAVFSWGCQVGVAHVNPAKDVPKFKLASQGFHAWTVDEVRQFEDTHPVGTTARLALALLLYTGQRRSDVILFGRQHVRDGRLHFTQEKNKNRKPVNLIVPVLPELRAVIDASAREHMTFLVNAHGRPFTNAGFGNRFRKWCDRAGLPQCSAHGLRKAGAVMAAENGATEKQLMAIFGWSTMSQAALYTRAANQQRLADDGMHLLMRK